MLSLPFVSRARPPVASEKHAQPGACPNCGYGAPGAYCPTCGQAQRSRMISLREMMVDFLDDQLSLNSRLPRTIGLLLTRPGLLTEEYLRGRIARSIRPLRLYLGASVVFFLLLSLNSGWLALGDGIAAETADSAPVEIPADAPLSPEVRAQVAAAQARAAEVRERMPAVEQSEWLDRIQVTGVPPAVQELVEERKEHFRGMTPREALREVGSAFREHVPTMMFLLLPLYALLLKLLYARRNRLYVEHFVFALHVHAFAFAIFSLMLLLPASAPEQLLVLWMLLYVFLAMRRVYRQSLLRTGAKYLALGLGYSLLLAVGLGVTALVTVLLV